MTQPPFSGNDFFDQIDSVARNLTGNAFRLKKNDKDAPRKFTEFVAQSEQEFGQQPQQAAQPQSFTDFEQGGFQQPVSDFRAEFDAAISTPPAPDPSQSLSSTFFNETPLGRGIQGLGRYFRDESPLTREGGFTGGEGLSGGIRQALSGIGPNYAAAAPGVEPILPETFVKGEGLERNIREGMRQFSHPQELLITAETAGVGPALSLSLKAAAAARKGWLANRALRLAANVVEPISGSVAKRAGFEAGAGLGANIGAEVGQDLLPGAAGTILGAIGGGLTGGGLGLGGVTGARKAVNLGEDYAAAVGRTGVGNVLDPVPPRTVAGRVEDVGAAKPKLVAFNDELTKRLETEPLQQFDDQFPAAREARVSKQIGREASPEVAAAQTGQPFESTLFRGFGRETPEEAFVPQGFQGNVVGDGTYATPDAHFSAGFGGEIEELRVSLRNPLVIKTDAEFAQITREAGLRSFAPSDAQEAASLRRVIEARGHDGLIVVVPDTEMTGKRLIEVFGSDTVVDFAGVRPDVTAARGIPEDAAAAARKEGQFNTRTDPSTIDPIDASFEEISEAMTNAGADEHAKLVRILGSEAEAKRFERLDRLQDSADEVRANAASKELDEMVSIEQEQLIGGDISNPEITEEALKELLSIKSLEFEEDLGILSSAMARGIGGLTPKKIEKLLGQTRAERIRNPDLVRFLKVQDSVKGMRNIGLDEDQIFEAVAKNLLRDGVEPDDVRFLLRDFLGGKSVTGAKSADALPPAGTTTAAARGAGGQRGFNISEPRPSGQGQRFVVTNEGSKADAMLLAPDENGKVIGSIVDFETDPSKLRQGFGEALVQDTMDALKERGATSFEVFAERGNSPALFGKLGFTETGVRNKFGDREMALDLIKGPEEVVLPEGFNLQAEMAKTRQRTLDDIIKNEPEVAREMGLLDPPATPATGTTAAARQVTPQQQAIIDDVGTGALPADDLAVDSIDKEIATLKESLEKYIDTKGAKDVEQLSEWNRLKVLEEARAASDPAAAIRAADDLAVDALDVAPVGNAPLVVDELDTVPASGLASDVTGGKPPTAGMAGTTPGSIEPKSGFRELQTVDELLPVIFEPTMNAKLGHILRSTQIGKILTAFNPALGANNEGKRLVIAYAHLLEEGTHEGNRILSQLDSVGSRRGLFGKVDERGLLSSGEFKGISMNEVAEKASLPVFRARMTADQRLYIDLLKKIDRAAGDFLEVHGVDINRIEDVDIDFASRRIYGKYGPDGELIATRDLNNQRPSLGSTKNVTSRTVRTAEELAAFDFVLLPYDEVVKLRVKYSYRIAADDNLVKHIKANYDFVDAPTPKDYAAAQKRLFDKQVATTPEGDQLLEDLLGKGGALEKYINKGPSNTPAKIIAGINNLGRTAELAGDASIFGIQLLGVLIEDMLPISARGGVRGIRGKRPGRTVIPTAKVFATTLVKGLLSPELARKSNAKIVKEATDEGLFKDTRKLILLAGDDKGEFTKGATTILDVHDYLDRKGGIRKVIGKLGVVYTRPLEALQEAYIAAMNVAGIQLWRALSPLTKNADGSINPKALSGVEDFINNTRGLQSSERLGAGGSRRYYEGQILLAARYRRATAALAASVTSGGVRGDLARNQIPSLLAGITATMAGFTIWQASKEDWSKTQLNATLEDRLIPGNGSYMMADIDGQKVGPGSKLISDVNFITKIMSQPSSMWDANLENNAWIRWLRSQSSFAIGDSISLLLGRDVVGNVTRPGPPIAIGGDTPSTREGTIALAKQLSSLGITIWAQSAAFEGGDAKQRLTRSGAEFIGARAYQQGRSSVLTKASFDKFDKSLEDLNQLERYELSNDPQLAPVLAEFDATRAATGEPFSSYRVERSDLEQVAFDRSSSFLEDMMIAIANGGSGGIKGKNGENDKPNAWSVLNTFADNIGEVKGTLSTQLDQYRHDHKLTGYVGEEPKNDFDQMLNEWYELLDVHTEKITSPRGREVQHKLNFDTWIPAADEFIAALSPELQKQLQQWRDRKQSPKGVEAILEARQPNVKYGVDKQGNPELPSSKQLYTAVTRLLASELGMTSEQFYALRDDN